MLETENSTLAGRIQDLERKVLDQGDEIMCLRATLADVLRRLNLVEGLRQNGPHTGSLTAPSTPVRNGFGAIQRSGVPVQKDLRLRTPTYASRIDGKEAKRVVYNNSALPQVNLLVFPIVNSRLKDNSRKT